MPQDALTRELTIIAQDPAVRVRETDKILRARVTVPREPLDPGPRGYRVRVTDYDTAHRTLYAGAAIGNLDPFEKADDSALLADPAFHAQNVYAIAMRTLSHFERALGRRLPWGFGGHQLTVVPHAFADSNAYYSEDDQALLFGYFPGDSGDTVFTCLSHDIIAHETAHALLDGLKDSYTLPSSPQQAGFHEGFADVVALLSVFALPEVVGALLPPSKEGEGCVDVSALTADALRRSALLGLAEQFGQATTAGRDTALRRSTELPTDTIALQTSQAEEAHTCGEILAAAMLNSFVKVWRRRLTSWLPKHERAASRERAVEDGVEAAAHLLTMAIRALDYCPVVDISFADYLSALLTADRELVPDDSRYHYRDALRHEFAAWGISPAAGAGSDGGGRGPAGTWRRAPQGEGLHYGSVHREALISQPDEVFRFLWENREHFGLCRDVWTEVVSVRPCVRLGPDGFILHETVAEYMQALNLKAGELAAFRRAGAKTGIPKPDGMPDDTPVKLWGGGVLVFDEYARLKFHIHSHLDSPERQGARLDYLWRNGLHDSRGRYGARDHGTAPQFALMHLQRSRRLAKEEW